MNFKKTVAGISAAAIAVTQVAAVIPMGAFAASEQPVSSNVQLALKYKASTSNGEVTADASAKNVVLSSDAVTAGNDETGLAFSYGGEISGAELADGDKYTFTADGLKIVANEKDKPAKDVTTTVLEGPHLLHNDRINVENAGDVNDVVTITYTKGDSDIKVVDSNGATISPDTSTDGTFTFTLTDDSASKFAILGGGVNVSSVKVTKTKTTHLGNINFGGVSEGTQTITIPEDAAAADKNTVIINAEVQYDAEGALGCHVAATNINNGSLIAETYGGQVTFDLDSNTSAFVLKGTNSIGSVELKSSTTTELNISGDIFDPITVSSDKFANAKVGDKIEISYDGGDIAVRSGENELALSNDKIIIDSDNIDSIKTNGIAVSGVTTSADSDITLTRVDLISKSEAVEGKEVVLFDSNESVVWSQTWIDETDGGYWSDEQTVSTSEISDNIGTVAAFKENYENITATWDSLTATKFVLDEGELWAGEEDLNYSPYVFIDRAAVKKGGKIIVEYKNADTAKTPSVSLCDANKKKFGDEFTSTITKANGSIEYVLDKAVAEEISTYGFFICGKGTTITSVKYEAPVEKKIDINSENFPDENFRSVLALYDEDKDNKLSESEIENITELNSGHTEQAALKNAQNFKGIEKLTALEKIYIDGNTAVTAIDLSQNENLTIISTEDCTNLDDLKLPDGIKSIWIGNTAITELNTASFTKLADLSISETKITSLDVSANTNLNRLSLNKSKVSELDLTCNTKLYEISAKNSELAKLILPSGMNVVELNVTGSRLTSIDLSNVEFDADSEVQLSGNIRKIGTVVNGEYDLSKLIEEGLDVSKMKVKTEGVTLDGNVLKGITGYVEYDYDTGSTVEGLEKVTFTLAPTKLTESSFVVKGNNKSVACETWDEVIKAMNDKNVDYAVLIAKDVSVDKLTFPTAAKAKSVSISRNTTEPVTITTKSASVTIPTNAIIADVNIEAVDNNGKQAKSFTISASKDLIIENLSIKADKAVIKGGAKSTLKIGGVKYSNNTDVVAAEINGFGTVDITDGYEVTFDRAVKATNLNIGAGATADFGSNSATFTNIIAGEESAIMYFTADYNPVAVTGNITGTVNVGIAYSKINSSEGNSGISDVATFDLDDVVLVSKTANLANISVDNAVPADRNYTLGRVGSDIKVMETAFTMNDVKYAQWSDALATIAANAKADKATAAKTSYRVIISDELNMNGAFKMPAAGTFSVLHFMGSSSDVPTIKFTGNITLTNLTIFENIKLDSVKKVNGTDSSVDFSIAAGKNELDLVNVKSGASIKSITSSGELYLCDVAASAITAADVNIVPTQQNGINSYGALVNGEWEGKDIKNPSVMVAGNLTVRNKLAIGGALTVKGILNVGKIYSNTSDATLVLYKQAKGKNALVIGRNGIENDSEQIKFVLADAETNKTAQITEDLVLGTIAGPYADQFVPSDDSLAETDSYRIIKDSNKLIAVPKEKDQKEYLVKVTVNGKAAYYKSLDAAVKEISATGRDTDNVVITVTKDMFKDSVANLPLPTAGKYGTLTYTAESAVTINVTSDLTLTGDLIIDNNVVINKVDKNNKVIPISLNIGKYDLTVNGDSFSTEDISDSEDWTQVNNRIANVSGTGTLNANTVIFDISGKVNAAKVVLAKSSIILNSKTAGFTGSIESIGDESAFSYDKSLSKNVKFNTISGALTLLIGDGDKLADVENTTLASITGDFTGDDVTVAAKKTLTVVRSGNTLKAVAADDVVEVEAWPLTPNGTYDDENTTTRLYDSVASAASDISRIKESASYKINLKKDDTLVLPKAKTYSRVMFEVSKDVEASKGVTLTTARDITFTGDFNVGENVTIVKANGTPLSINAGTYRFWNDGKVAPDENGVSQYNNIISKDYVYLTNESKINGNLNVSDLWISGDVELGSKATFNASKIYVYNLDNSVSIKYPVKNAKNVKFGKADGINKLNLSIEDVKEGDQIAVLTGDYYYGTVLINGFEPDEDTDLNSGLVAARSGNKLMAINFENACLTIIDAEHEEDMKHILYVSYADAIADINRLNDPNGVYMVYLPTNISITRLTLPTKGKYNTLGLLNWTDEVTLKLTSDVALTGNLGVYSGVILQKNEGTSKDILKFTSPKGKDNKPLYTVAAEDGGIIVNGTLNGEKIDSPEKPVVENVTLPYTNKDGFDLSNGAKLKIAKTAVEEGGVITITTAEEVPDSSIKMSRINSDGRLALTHASGTKVYTLTIDDVELVKDINKYGLMVSGSEGKVTSITYTAPTPAPQATSVTELPWSGSSEFDADGNGSVLEVAKGLITVSNVTTVTVNFTANADADTYAATITDNSGNVLATTAKDSSLNLTLTKEQSQKLFDEGFKVKGKNVTITGISFTADTNAGPILGF